MQVSQESSVFQSEITFEVISNEEVGDENSKYSYARRYDESITRAEVCTNDRESLNTYESESRSASDRIAILHSDVCSPTTAPVFPTAALIP